MSYSFSRRDSNITSEPSEYNSVKSIKYESEYGEARQEIKEELKNANIIETNRFDGNNKFEFEDFNVTSFRVKANPKAMNNESPTKMKLKLKLKSELKNSKS